MGGEAAVPRVSGEKRTVAEIFHALPAEATDAAGVAEPGDSHPLANPVGSDVAADEVDAADDFMAGNDRIFYAGKLGVDDVKVGPANPAGAHGDANFVIARERVRARQHLEQRPRSRQHHRTHLLLQRTNPTDEQHMHRAVSGALDLPQNAWPQP